jgi:hypothetical protein
MLNQKPELPSLTRHPVKIEFVNLDEGIFGDFDPDDIEDVNLLRFDVSQWNDEHKDWDEVPDGSFCTRLPANTSRVIFERALVTIMNLVYDDIVNTGKSKRNCEQMSWLCPKDFQ